MQKKTWMWQLVNERNPTTRRTLTAAFLVLGLMLAGPGWAAGGHLGGSPTLYEPASWWAALGQALEQGWAWLTGTSGTPKAPGSSTVKTTACIDPNGRPTPCVQGQATTQSDGTAAIDPNGHP